MTIPQGGARVAGGPDTGGGGLLGATAGARRARCAAGGWLGQGLRAMCSPFVCAG
jgi:hypothetical protein